MTILTITILTVLVLIAAALFVGYTINNYTAKPKVLTYDEVYQKLSSDEDRIPAFDEFEFEDFELSSDFGYNLFAKWAPVKGSKKSVILVHGFTGNIPVSMRYFNLFHTRGYNVLMYDHRFHGKSGGGSCSMGYYEKHDLVKFIDWVENRVGKQSVIGLHGESMGASTSLMTAQFDKRISFIIADCGFCDFYHEAKYRLKADYKLPEFPFLYLSDFINKIRFKHSYKEISPIENINAIECPVFFIHGDRDRVTKVDDSIKMHEKFDGKKELLITQDTGHAGSIHRHKQLYFEAVDKFLKDNC